MSSESQESTNPTTDDPDTTAEPIDDAASARACDLLREMLEHIGAQATIEVTAQDDEGLHLNLVGDDLGVLIGKRGQTLHALQYLTNTILNHSERDRDGLRVVLDAASYRERRHEALAKMAHKAADKVMDQGRRVRLDPMPSYERRIIHMVLSEHPTVQTESYGEEPYRQVIVELKEKPRSPGSNRGGGRSGRQGGDRPAGGGTRSAGGGAPRFGSGLLPPARSLSSLPETPGGRTAHRPEKKGLQEWDQKFFDDMFRDEEKK